MGAARGPWGPPTSPRPTPLGVCDMIFRPAWRLLLATALAMPAQSSASPSVPTIFEAENVQGVEGDRSLIVLGVVYFFHDGSYDAFDVGSRASPGIAAIAHGRTGATLAEEFRRVQPDGLITGVAHGLAFQNPELLQFHAREQTLDPAKHRYLSYVAQVFPSDDAFVGNDNPRAHEVFDERGVFQGPIVIDLTGADVLDAGTRVNDEMDIAGFDAYPTSDVGVVSDEVIREHPGFNGSQANPSGAPVRILGGQAQYTGAPDGSLHRVDPVLGDFTRAGFRLNRFRLTSRLSAYFSGAWYNPSGSGEGFLVHIFDAAAPKAALTWFTYAADGSGRQMWLTGTGPIDNISARVELFVTQGGRLASTDNPATVRRTRWEVATLGFSTCVSGGVLIQPDDPALPRGLIPIERLTAPAAGTERDCGGYTLGAPDAAYPGFP